MGFQAGLSGLSAASQNLDVIGNNIANAATVGFKQSRTIFSDVFANSLGGSGSNTVGIGTQVAEVQQQFTQGAITATTNPLDFAINGKGFFRLSNSGVISYSRAGEFHLDNAGFVVSSEGYNLTGYGVDTNGTVVATAPNPIQLQTSLLQPTATTEYRASLNVDSRDSVPAVATFDPTDPGSYNNSTSGTVYDSLGNPHVFTQYFVKSSTAGAAGSIACAIANPRRACAAVSARSVARATSSRRVAAKPVI